MEPNTAIRLNVKSDGTEGCFESIGMTCSSSTAQLQLRRGCRKLVEEEIDGGNLSVPSNDEIGSSVNRWLARTARNPWDSTAVANYLGLGNWLILEIRMGCFDFT